jgi:hypothetical protein
MYLLYLDDSGSAKNVNEEHLVLAGICLHEKKSYWINRHLDDLAKDIYPEDPNSIEFHASQIYAGKKEPWSLKSRLERLEIIKSVLKVVPKEARDSAIFACAVHKPSFPNHDPMELAFENLCSRFDLFLKRVYHQRNEDHKGIIILDESSHETTLQKLAIDFRQIGTKWDVINNLNEVPLFVSSKASRCIQLADHIAYAIYRRYEARDLNYFEIIQGCFDSEGERIHGLVHKQYNLSSCTCPACVTRKLTTSG